MEKVHAPKKIAAQIGADETLLMFFK